MEIAHHLPHVDLQHYSLASHALNREANRILWRSVAVAPCSLIERYIGEFADALMRDPIRAANIRHIKFVPSKYQRICCSPRMYEWSIFPPEPTEEFWTSLEEALRLLVGVRNVRLHNASSSTDSSYPDRFLDIIGSALGQLSIVHLDAQLRPNRLFQLCRAWRPLTALSAKSVSKDPLIDFSPNIFSQLRHVELDHRLICHIVPGRPLETIYHAGVSYGCGDAFDLLTDTLRGCTTLLRARVYCVARDEDDAAKLLPAFAHGNIREFHLFVALKHTLKHEFGSLTSSLTMQALPSGVSTYLPKLEFLQIVLCHRGFDAQCRDHITTTGDSDAVVKSLGEFLTSEGHRALKGVEISFWSGETDDNGAIRFLATRAGSRWDVNVAEWGPSALPRFEDVF